MKLNKQVSYVNKQTDAGNTNIPKRFC